MKKFGRNQKRKMREHIARLELKIGELSGTLDRARSDARYNAEIVETMRRVLDRFFVAFREHTINVSEADFEKVMRARKYFIAATGAEELSHYTQENFDLSPLERHYIELGLIETKAFIDFAAGALHLKLQSQSGDCAYIESARALEVMSPQELAKQILPKMCRSIIDAAQKEQFACRTKR